MKPLRCLAPRLDVERRLAALAAQAVDLDTQRLEVVDGDPAEGVDHVHEPEQVDQGVVVDGQPEQLLGGPGDGGDARPFAVREQVGPLVLGKGVQLVEQPREAAALAEVVGRRPVGQWHLDHVAGQPEQRHLPGGQLEAGHHHRVGAPAAAARPGVAAQQQHRDPAGDGRDQPVGRLVAVAVPRVPLRVLAREDRGHQVIGLEVVEGGGGVRGRGQGHERDQPGGRPLAPAARGRRPVVVPRGQQVGVEHGDDPEHQQAGVGHQQGEQGPGLHQHARDGRRLAPQPDRHGQAQDGDHQHGRAPAPVPEVQLAGPGQEAGEQGRDQRPSPPVAHGWPARGLPRVPPGRAGAAASVGQHIRFAHSPPPRSTIPRRGTTCREESIVLRAHYHEWPFGSCSPRRPQVSIPREAEICATKGGHAWPGTAASRARGPGRPPGGWRRGWPGRPR